MPTFVYRGLDKAGKSVGGEIAADDERGAIALIKAQGLFPTEVNPPTEAKTESNGSGGSVFHRLSGGFNSDLTVLTRQLANLAAGGVPLMSAFAALTEHTENPKLQAVLMQMQQDVQSGKTLWEALGAHPRVFPPLYVHMVKAGEASGQLGTVLLWLADYQEKEQTRRTQIRGALAYPMLLVSAGIISIALLTTLVVPKFISMFQEFEQALPLPTLILINVSHFLSQWWWVILGLVVVVVLGLRRYAATPQGRYRMDGWKLHMPIFRKLTIKSAMSRFARTTSTLLQGGVPLLDALAVVRDVLNNEVLAQATDQAREGMREGESFAARLKQTGVFPPLVTHMVAIGEETGDLYTMLNTVASTYDVEVEAALKSMVSLLEPLIIIAVGGTIGFIILAMLLPVFTINVMGG